MSTTTYKVQNSDWEFETKIVITDNKQIKVYQDKKCVLTLTKQEDSKVKFKFYDTCEDEWDKGVCSNDFENIKQTIVQYPFDFQVYSL